MPKMIFVNLPVKDLAASTRFYEAIGCEKNPMFSDENASAMVWSDAISFMLLTHGHFSQFVTKPIGDSHKDTSVIIALSRDSREEVDAMIAAAAANGGKVDVRPPQELDFMYQRTFEDPDGHVFEPAWMNMAAFPGADEQA
jgi:uncharacterized protein